MIRKITRKETQMYLERKTIREQKLWWEEKKKKKNKTRLNHLREWMDANF